MQLKDRNDSLFLNEKTVGGKLMTVNLQRNTNMYSTAWNYGTICRDFASVEPQFWSAVSPRENHV